jgi:hypothetical protein
LETKSDFRGFVSNGFPKTRFRLVSAFAEESRKVFRLVSILVSRSFPVSAPYRFPLET